MLESLVTGAASGAGGVGVLRPPGGVGGKLALVGPHLVEASCYKVVQAYERVGIEAVGEDIVVRGGWRESHSLNMWSLERSFRAFYVRAMRRGGG